MTLTGYVLVVVWCAIFLGAFWLGMWIIERLP